MTKFNRDNLMLIPSIILIIVIIFTTILDRRISETAYLTGVQDACDIIQMGIYNDVDMSSSFTLIYNYRKKTGFADFDIEKKEMELYNEQTTE